MHPPNLIDGNMTDNTSQKQVRDLAGTFEEKTAEELLSYATSTFKGRLALATSFSAEDSILTHMITLNDPETRIFTLDTGRLPEETYQVWDETEKKYMLKITAHHPSEKRVEEMLESNGPYSFRKSVALRKECCSIRKTEPLKRALKGIQAWITGLRREQSVTRKNIKKIEVDELNGGILKLNPLADWDNTQVWEYIQEHEIPYNSLHDKGYPSIGCEPCTRSVKEDEDIRTGRWWWESPETKECGLHGNCKVK